jgi:hypothetical protein
MDDWSSVRLCDVGNLLLSGVLFFSPWMFDLSTGAQIQTASAVGTIIAVLSIAALAAFAVWEEWLILIAGLMLMVSPWLLGFQDSQAMTINVAIGVSVAALAAFEAWYLYAAGRRSQAWEGADKPKNRKSEPGRQASVAAATLAFHVPTSTSKYRCLAF